MHSRTTPLDAYHTVSHFIVFDGNYQQVIGSHVSKFLEECKEKLSSVVSNVQCTDVQRVDVSAGAVIILELRGPRTNLNAAVADVAANGLDLPSFQKLLVAGVTEWHCTSQLLC